jgi:hypothetical protein
MPLQEKESGNKNSFVTSYIGLLPIKSRISGIGNSVDWGRRNNILSP